MQKKTPQSLSIKYRQINRSTHTNSVSQPSSVYARNARLDQYSETMNVIHYLQSKEAEPQGHING